MKVLKIDKLKIVYQDIIFSKKKIVSILGATWTTLSRLGQFYQFAFERGDLRRPSPRLPREKTGSPFAMGRWCENPTTTNKFVMNRYP